MCELTVESLPAEERRQWVRDLLVEEGKRLNLAERPLQGVIQYADDLLKDNFSAARTLQLAKQLALELSRLDTFNTVLDRVFGIGAPTR